VDLFLTPEDRGAGLVRALYERVRGAIDEGRIGPGDALPPSRDLARQLGVSRHTVTTAYGYLVAEGFLDGAAGGGTRVSPLAARAGGGRPARRFRSSAATPPPPGAAAPGGGPGAGPALRLPVGLPDPSLFPAAAWRRCVARALREPESGYGDHAGEPALRAAIAAYVHRSRGVTSGPDGVVVAAGAQQAFALALLALVRPGEVVAVEDPGYARFRLLAEARGARVVPVPVDGEGLVVDALPPRARLVHVTPSHQFPTGVALSLARRRALAAWARRTGAVVLEDDYDSEFRHARRPLEPLYRLDPGGRVVYVGSFSKSFSPALRLGFAVAAPELARELAAMRALADWHSPAVLQRALAAFLAEGEMDRHVRRARRAYRERHDRIVAGLAGILARGTGRGRPPGQPPALVASGAGLHVAVELPRGEEERVLSEAREAGLDLEGMSPHAVASRREGVLVGFGAVGLPEVERGLAVLASVIPHGSRRR